jgi:hypothetical protein
MHGSSDLKQMMCNDCMTPHVFFEHILLQVHMPKTGQGQSLVEFLKRGPLGPEDIKAVARAMRAANTIQSADAGLQVRCGGMCCSPGFAQCLTSQC